jgi:hypothetical protein
MAISSSLISRVRAAGLHLLASCGVAAIAALLILKLWFPGALAELAGGRELFWIVLGVDVVLGPLITLAVFDVRKSRGELARDLAVVAGLQIAALAYGLHTVHQARPAFLVLEKDRVRVLRPIDLEAADLAKAPEGLQRVSWFGPKLAATRDVRPDEVLAVSEQALAGKDIGSRPDFWLAQQPTAASWAKASQSLAKLHTLHPSRKADIDAAVKATGKPESEVKWLAILARNTDHTALIDAKTGDIVGYAPVDGN